MFKKFRMLNYNPALQQDEQIDMLLNTDQIVSIKSIKMMTKEQDVIKGYWIRLTNNKKYKAISIPEDLEKLFDQKLKKPTSLTNFNLSVEDGEADQSNPLQ